jgi:hypothetical protein
MFGVGFYARPVWPAAVLRHAAGGGTPTPTPTPAPTLTAPSGTFTLAESAAAGALAGSLVGTNPSATLSLLDDAGGRVALSGTDIIRGATALNYEAAASHGFVLRQALAGATNSPLDTPLTLAVTNVFEAPALAALSLSTVSVPEDSAAAIDINGKTAASTIAVQSGALPTGMSLVGAQITGTPTTPQTASFTLRETLADSPNSPRDTALSIEVTAVVVGDTTAPVLSSPAGTATGQTTATISVNSNEANGTLYWAVTTSATPPGDESAIMAGTGAAAFASQEVNATGAQNFTATGLAASTTCYPHFVQRDEAGNYSSIVSGAGFTTASTAPVTLSPTSAGIPNDLAAGSFITGVGSVPAGTTPTVSPNDGRFVIAGSEASGWTVRRGLSAVSNGTITLTVSATGATSATIDVTVSAATSIAFEPWMLFYNVDGSRITTGVTNKMAPGGFYTVSDATSLRNSAGNQASVGDYVQTIQDRSIAPADATTTANNLVASTTGGVAATADTNRGQLISTNQRGGFNTVRLDNTGSTLSRRYVQQTGGAHSVMRRVFSRYVRPPASAAIKVALGDSSGNSSTALITSDATVLGRTSLGTTTGATGNLETVTTAGWRRHTIRKQHTNNTFYGKIAATEADAGSGNGFTVSGGRAVVGNQYGGSAGEDCDFACFLDYPVALSRWHEQMFEGWEAHTFGWAVDLPSEHPFKGAPPKVPAGTLGIADVVGFNLAASTRRQKWLGCISEWENGPHDPSVQSNPHTLVASPNWGALRDMLPSGLRASTTLSEADIVGTKFKEIRDRFYPAGANRVVQHRAGNQCYLGFQQTDAATGLGKLWGEKFTGQNAQYKRFYATLKGVILCYSTVEPFWKANNAAPYGTLRGSAHANDARFVASASGTTLTVTSFTGGTPLAVGMTIARADAVNVMSRITALGTGTGGVGTYTLSGNTTLNSGTTTACYALDELRTVDPTAYATQMSAITGNIVGFMEWWHQNMCPVLGFDHNEMTNPGDWFGTCTFTDQLIADFEVSLLASLDASSVFTTQQKADFFITADSQNGPGTALMASSAWADSRLHPSIHRIFGGHDANQDAAKTQFSTWIAPFLKTSLQSGVNNTEFEQGTATALDDASEQQAWCAGTMLNRLNYKTLCRARVHSQILHGSKWAGQVGQAGGGNQSTGGYSALKYGRAEYAGTAGEPAPGDYAYQAWNFNGYAMDLDNIPSGTTVLEANYPGQVYGQSGIAQTDAYAVNNGTGRQVTASLDDDGNVYWEVANQTASAWTLTLWLGANRTTRFRRYSSTEIGAAESLATGQLRTITVPAYSGVVVTP